MSPVPSTVKCRRAQPWFGRYSLCGHLQVRWAYALRGLDHAHIDRVIDYRRQWTDIRINHGGSWRSESSAGIGIPQQDDLHSLCDFLLTETDRKLVVESDRVSVYTNNHNFLERLARFPVGRFLWIAEIELAGEPGAVNLRSSTYQWRTYFRTQQIENQQRHSLRSYLDSQPDIRIGPSLRYALDNEYQKLHDFHFIDHNDHAVITMMSLIRPGLIRKTLPIRVYK